MKQACGQSGRAVEGGSGVERLFGLAVRGWEGALLAAGVGPELSEAQLRLPRHGCAERSRRGSRQHSRALQSPARSEEGSAKAWPGLRQRGIGSRQRRSLSALCMRLQWQEGKPALTSLHASQQHAYSRHPGSAFELAVSVPTQLPHRPGRLRPNCSAELQLAAQLIGCTIGARALCSRAAWRQRRCGAVDGAVPPCPLTASVSCWHALCK